MSPKQDAILKYLREHETMDLDAAISVAGGYYANGHKHVGTVLYNMVKRRLIRRLKPGVFCGALYGKNHPAEFNLISDPALNDSRPTPVAPHLQAGDGWLL